MSHTAPPVKLAAALYVVATPLGNRDDITARALNVLHNVAAIACEDTRHSQKLFAHYGIRAPLLAVHEHNEAAAAEQLIQRIQAGQAVALVTDAGTPGISDPGARAVRAVQQAGLGVVPIPGASALITALSVSGLIFSQFFFAGFLPVKAAARRAMIESIASLDAAIVFYEAPHRIADTLADLAACLPAERELLIARELTKLFEQIERMPLGAAPAWLAQDAHRAKGEFVLVLAPPQKPAAAAGPSAEAQRVLRLLLKELPLKTAAHLAAEITGEAKNTLYAQALAWKEAQAED